MHKARAFLFVCPCIFLLAASNPLTTRNAIAGSQGPYVIASGLRAHTNDGGRG
jgi:hypothetical protein